MSFLCQVSCKPLAPATLFRFLASPLDSGAKQGAPMASSIDPLLILCLFTPAGRTGMVAADASYASGRPCPT